MRCLAVGVLLVLAVTSISFSHQAPGRTFDVVFAGGRVIDPASGLDAVRDVGVAGTSIAALAPAGSLKGKLTINAKGLVVTAGFIDLHQHGQTPENYALKARDGVTSALEMEVGVFPVNPWYAHREGKALINYGASVGHIPVRMAIMGDSGKFLPRDKAVNTPANSSQQKPIFENLQKGLDAGALGIGTGLAYTPAASPQEILGVFKLASKARVPVFSHLGSAGPVKPGGLEAMEEVMAFAASTGASLHVVHMTSTLLRQTPLALEMIEGAEAHHLDVTTESYPYTAGMTQIESAIFSPGWEARNGGITYHDLQWAATGERLTADSFARYRKEGGMVAIHSISEDIVRGAMADPHVMIASDGILADGKGHPRASGTYARILAKYVRDEHVLSLTDALRKMSLMPAQRLNLPKKGRLKEGADADIVAFDPKNVQDKATFESPALPSEGIPFVMVSGTLVARDGKVQPNVFPGQGLRRSPAGPK